MVRVERSRTGYFHGHLDSVYLHLRNLFQTVRPDEQKKMNFDLIYIAVVIFSLLIIGLVLTVLEFKQM